MNRWYILPIEEVDVGGMPARGPLHFAWKFSPAGIHTDWQLMDYGSSNAAIVVADVDISQHANLIAQVDVFSAPTDLNQHITEEELSQLTTVLENLHFPADWITTSLTYRQLIRRIAGMCQFSQNHDGTHAEKLVTSKTDLDLRWRQLPSAKRDRITAAAEAAGYDMSKVTRQTLVRAILADMGAQRDVGDFKFGKLATL